MQIRIWELFGGKESRKTKRKAAGNRKKEKGGQKKGKRKKANKESEM